MAPPLLCGILRVVAAVKLGVMATGKLGVPGDAKPAVWVTEGAGSFGHPCCRRMSTHSWLPAI